MLNIEMRLKKIKNQEISIQLMIKVRKAKGEFKIIGKREGVEQNIEEK
jgi:hypothetical protein